MAEWFLHEVTDSKNNSSADQQVVDRSAKAQHNNRNNVDLLGFGRSYNCVFCKRGFNTAQALGGHMNVHRKNKDRPSASNEPNSHYSCSNKIICTDIADGGNEQNSSGSSLNRCYDQLQHQQSNTYPAASPHSGNGSLSIYIYNTPSNSHHQAVIRDDPPRYCRNFFGDDNDSHMSLGSLQFGRAAHVQQDMENMGQLPNHPDEAKLDLELRLGHD